MGRVAAAWQGLRRLVARGGLMLAAAFLALGVSGAPESMAASTEAAAPDRLRFLFLPGRRRRGSTGIERLDRVVAVSSGAGAGVVRSSWAAARVPFHQSRH